jgi:hypothetical protein
MKRRNLLLLPLAAAIAASNPAENQPAAPGSLTHQAAVDQLYANHWRANGYRILGPVDYSQPLAWHREALRQHENLFARLFSKFGPEIFKELA